MTATPKLVRWSERPATPSPGGYVRPSSWRLEGDWSIVAAVSPVTTPADPDWKSKPYSLEASTSAEAFNRLVGWDVARWHWSIVKNGAVVATGDEPTAEAGRKAVRAAMPPRIARNHCYGDELTP